MGSSEGKRAEASAKELEVRLAAVEAYWTEEDAVDHLPRVGQRMERRRSGYAGHKQGQQRKVMDLTARKTEEKKPKQAGCSR